MLAPLGNGRGGGISSSSTATVVALIEVAAPSVQPDTVVAEDTVVSKLEGESSKM